MNLNQLQYFKILAQEEHYTRAAQMLSITQPSLSHAIAQLEEELGTRLFEKKGRNIVLTRYGKLFLPYVEESLKVLEEGVQRTRELNGSKEGIIHLAYIYTMGSKFILKKEAGCVRSLTRCLRRSISSRRLPLRWRRTPVWQVWSHRDLGLRSCRISQS